MEIIKKVGNFISFREKTRVIITILVHYFTTTPLHAMSIDIELTVVLLVLGRIRIEYERGSVFIEQLTMFIISACRWQNGKYTIYRYYFIEARIRSSCRFALFSLFFQILPETYVLLSFIHIHIYTWIKYRIVWYKKLIIRIKKFQI